jgi:alkanesulfonate monooxygenase SsuD/methylene tetrahydromethanopterin reductase-like flavin-dependent oxidoreductase (luciferase family)
VRFGILVPQDAPWASFQQRCQEVEALSYDSLWIGDHFHLASMPHVQLLDAAAALAGIALTTSSIRFGALTTTFIYRHPAVVAKQAATIDQMSGGRFELGLGTGVYEADHLMTGSMFWPPGERVDRFRESVEIVDRLLRGNEVTYEGTYYQVREAVVRPRPAQLPRPPLTIGANGPRMMRIAAEYADRWNTWGGRGHSSEELLKLTSERVQMLVRRCDELGRDPATITKSFYVYRPLEPWASPAAFESICEAYSAIGIDELIMAYPGFLENQQPQHQIEVFHRVASDLLGKG